MMDDQKPVSNNTIRDIRSDEIDNLQRNQLSVRYSIPRHGVHQTLSSDYVYGVEESLPEAPKRRKLEGHQDDFANGLLNNKAVSEIPGSSWEWRKMKGEMIDLRIRLSYQEAAVQQLHRERREMEESFKKERKLLEIKIEQDKQTIGQLKFQIHVGQQSIEEARAAQAQAERELFQMQTKMKEKVLYLVDDNKLKAEFGESIISQEIKPDITKPYETTARSLDHEHQLELAYKRISNLEDKLKESAAIMQKFEIQCVEIQRLKIKNASQLENESFKIEDGTKFMQRRSKENELEKELLRAQNLIASLRESMKGKLLVEEQMATMEHRLRRTESLEKQVSQLEVTQCRLLSKIDEYEAIGIPGGAIAIRREINRLQQSEAVFTAEERQLRSQVDSVNRELDITKKQNDEMKKSLIDVTASQESLDRFVSRLRKKLSLVTRERDSYRQQLDMYEKEITGYETGENATITNERIPILERTIEGYRELVAKLESDLEACDGKGQKEENRKLQAEIDKLRGELEYRALAGDFNVNTRILHHKFNPLALMEQQAEEKQRSLLQELEQLRAIVASGKTSLQENEIAELQRKHEIKIARLKEVFKTSSREYRQTCYQLFGWRVDRMKEGQYKLLSQYTQSPDDYLLFIISDDGLSLTKTPFLAKFTTFIERYLKLQDNLPMFLSAVLSDLSDRQSAMNALAS